ncbi:hypothetical protein HR45_07670, partial [Shewanella mangrovi]
MNTVTIQQGGQIQGLNGQISIIVDGKTRPLQDGEIVPTGAQLVIADNATAQLVTSSGAVMNLSDAGETALSAAPEFSQPADANATGNATTDAEIQQLQALIAAGEDPTANLPETAAGGNLANQGGSGYVTLSRDGSEVIASSGYDTATFTTPTSTSQETLPTYDLTATTLNDSNTIAEDSVATGNVLSNDTATGIELAVTSFVVEGNSYAANSTVELENGMLVLNADGSYSFTPDANWNGDVPVITYTTNTGNTATLTITVTPVDDPTLANDDAITIPEDTVASGNVLDNDSDIDSVLSVATYVINGDTFVAGSSVELDEGTLQLNADGSYTFTPVANWNGSVPEVTYTTNTGATATLNITVTPVEDPSVISADEGAVVEDEILTAAGTLTATDVDNPALSFVADSVTDAYGTFSVDANGVWTYTLNNEADIVQALADGEVVSQTFSVGLSDGSSTTVDITITGTPDAPVISGDGTDDLGTVQEDVTLTTSGTITATDVDNGAVLTFSGDSSGDFGDFTIDPDTGDWTFTLDNANQQALAQGETHTETFVVTVTDEQGLTDTQEVSIIITGTNDAPVITSGPQTGSVQEDITLTANGTVTADDVDNGAVLSFSGNATGTYGSFAIDAATGEWIYTLDNANQQALAQGETHTDTFTVTVTDEFGATDTQLVTITINGTNDAPVITSDTQTGTVQEDITLTATGTVTADDVDNGAVLSFSGNATGTYGSFAIDSNTGEWIYTLDNANQQALAQGETHTDTFTVTVTDEFGATDTQLVTITINGTNDAPVITSDTQTGSVQEDTTLTANGTVTADDVDNGAILSFSGNATGTYGSFAIDAATGEWIYTLDNANQQALAQGETHTETFTVTVTDEFGATDTQLVTITINGTNDA